MTELRDRTVPWWVTLIIVLITVPGFLIPLCVSASHTMPENIRIFLWLFPFYLVVGAWLSWICYGRRTYMTWILLIIMALTDAAMYMLINL